MGTNYYIKHKIRSETKDELRKLIDSEDWDSLKNRSYEVAEESYTHIGKSSYGWSFLFRYNEVYGREDKITRLAVMKYIKECIKKGDKVVDEYGDDIYVGDLNKLIMSKKNLRRHDILSDSQIIKSIDGFDFSKNDFC